MLPNSITGQAVGKGSGKCGGEKQEYRQGLLDHRSKAAAEKLITLAFLGKGKVMEKSEYVRSQLLFVFEIEYHVAQAEFSKI